MAYSISKISLTSLISKSRGKYKRQKWECTRECALVIPSLRITLTQRIETTNCIDAGVAKVDSSAIERTSEQVFLYVVPIVSVWISIVSIKTLILGCCIALSTTRHKEPYSRLKASDLPAIVLDIGVWHLYDAMKAIYSYKIEWHFNPASQRQRAEHFLVCASYH